MCDDHWPAVLQTTGQTDAPRLQIPLQPVDEVTVTTLVDNVTDALATDQGPAERPPAHNGARVANRVGLEGWGSDALVAEHGFSALVTVRTGHLGPEVVLPAHCTGRDLLVPKKPVIST